jgi:hypothetical protein
MLDDIKPDGTFQYRCMSEECATTTLFAHVSHETVQWGQDGDLVHLTPCPDCGMQMAVKTQWKPRDLLPALVTRGVDVYTGKEDAILSVMVPGSPNLTWIESHTEKRVIDGQSVEVLVIDAVYPHPAIARHRQLAQHMELQGKTRPVP